MTIPFIPFPQSYRVLHPGYTLAVVFCFGESGLLENEPTVPFLRESAYFIRELP